MSRHALVSPGRPFGDSRTIVRGSYGLFYDRVPLRPLANALLSANNTTDYSQARLLSYTFTPKQAGAPTFPNVAAAPPAGALENFSTMQNNIQNPYLAASKPWSGTAAFRPRARLV